MSKPNSDKTWKELTPPEVDHFFKICADRAEKLGQLAESAGEGLAKYLFAANTGAAAGMFLLLKSPDDHKSYLAAFYLFCGGTFFVGVSHFVFAKWAGQLSEGWTADFNAVMRDEMTLGQLDARHRQRNRSFKKKLAWYGLIISFCLLVIGGLVAARPFWSHPLH